MKIPTLQLLLVVTLIFSMLLASCATDSSKLNRMVGRYTYSEALSEYGPPDESVLLPDGQRISSWTTSIGRNWIDKLILTFDSQNRLVNAKEKRL
jgi:hypothetical protein